MAIARIAAPRLLRYLLSIVLIDDARIRSCCRASRGASRVRAHAA